MQQADGLVLLGAFTVQGGLVAGELVAQPGDGVVRRGQLRGGGGEGGVVPLLILLAGAGSVRAGCLGCGQGGLTPGAGGGGGLFCFGDPGCGCPAFVVQGSLGVAGPLLGVPARGGLGFGRGDGLGGGGAGLGGIGLGGVPGDRLAGGLGAGLLGLGGGLGADRLACASAASRSPAAASWSPRAASWSSAADSCAPSLLIAASASSRMAEAWLMAAVTGRSWTAGRRAGRGAGTRSSRCAGPAPGAVPAVFGDLLLAVTRARDPARRGP